MINTPQTIVQPAGSGLYTALQISAALGISKRNTLKALAGLEPSGAVLIHGNETPAWTFDTLPETMRQAIGQAAGVDRLSIADYLDSICKPWQPKIPLSEITDAGTAQARKLRDALLPALQRMDSPTLTPADQLRLGLADYSRAIGEQITERHWRRLMARTLRRAGSDENFERLELYLPENLARKSAPPARLAFDFKPLAEFIATFADPAKPTENEKAALWAQVFELFTAGADTRRERKQLRKAIATQLHQAAPWLAKSRHSLCVTFDRKLAIWESADGNSAKLVDGRALKRGEQRAPAFPQEDIDLLSHRTAFQCGGRLAQAVRDFAGSGNRSGLSEATTELILRPHVSKSYVNRRLAKAVRRDVDLVAPYILGRKAIDDATAHVERDYSKLVSMQVIGADDLTAPVYFYVPDGKGWFTLTRGQVLAMVDSRSLKIVAWSLQPERNYNSLVIRTLMNRVCAAWGVPQVWAYERGIWERSHLVKGTLPAGWQVGLSGPDCATAWEKMGVRFMHSIRARSKPVERVFGAIQDLMEGVRGYCGRDERRDLPAVTKQAMQDIQFRRVNHPGELFLSFEEWETELGRIIERYNGTSQDGKVLRGLSPDEAFEKYWPHDNPPSKLDASCWHLLAHYAKPVPVTTNGICFRIGGKKYVYRNERTGQDRGKTVFAWFDPECPEILCVTDLNKKNPYLVERATDVDFMAEPGDQVLQRELAKAAAHSAYPKARFHVLKSKFAPSFRRNFVDAETADMAAQISDGRKAIETGQRQQAAQITRTRKAYSRLGMTIPPADRLRPDAPEAASRLSELLSAPDTE